jgi:hypothetical protein
MAAVGTAAVVGLTPVEGADFTVVVEEVSTEAAVAVPIVGVEAVLIAAEVPTGRGAAHTAHARAVPMA